MIYMRRNLIMSRITLYACSSINNTCRVLYIRTHYLYLRIPQGEYL